MRERAYVGDKVRVRLAYHTDAANPVLEAMVLKSTGFPGSVSRVRITGAHSVWTGAELGSSQFKVVREAEMVSS